MGKGRLEAFSDGVIAVIITVMVLELKVPHGIELPALLPSIPVFLSYVLSYVFVGIYWNNHHHMLHAVQHVSGGVLWANLHLLFWLSLVPFVTGWMSENQFAAVPVALYGGTLRIRAPHSAFRIRNQQSSIINKKRAGRAMRPAPGLTTSSALRLPDFDHYEVEAVGSDAGRAQRRRHSRIEIPGCSLGPRCHASTAGRGRATVAARPR